MDLILPLSLAYDLSKDRGAICISTRQPADPELALALFYEARPLRPPVGRWIAGRRQCHKRRGPPLGPRPPSSKVPLRQQQMDRLHSDYGVTDNAEQAELRRGNLPAPSPAATRLTFFKIYSISQVINMIYGAEMTVSETTKRSGGSSPKEMLSGVFCCACNAVSMQL